ncbi:MAG: hypothetical protein P8174_04400 [Gemmatimonadota bacterium]
MMSLANVAAAILVASVAGCAANGIGPVPRADQNVLTRREIMSVQGVRDLYDVVQRLRPHWIEVDQRAQREDMNGSSRGVLVYQGQAYLGGLDVLRQLKPDMAYEMRWLDGPTAASTLPFGLRYGRVAGAIVIRADPTPG